MVSPLARSLPFAANCSLDWICGDCVDRVSITKCVICIGRSSWGDGLEGAKPGSFSDAFFFSVQTLASIGYGAIHPKTFYANSIVTIL